MASTYTDSEVQAVLLRAQRALLAISNRIDRDLIYLYSGKYMLLKSQQYDIYSLYETILREYPYTPYDAYFYPLVAALIDKCQEVDSYTLSGTLNPLYENISGTSTTVIIPEDVFFTIERSQADLVEDGTGSGIWYLPMVANDSTVPVVTSVFVICNGFSLPGAQLDTVHTPNRVYGFLDNSTAVIKVTYTRN